MSETESIAETLTILYLDHVESDGRLLFEQIVKMDFDGIVCKRKDSPYKVTEMPCAMGSR